MECWYWPSSSFDTSLAHRRLVLCNVYLKSTKNVDIVETVVEIECKARIYRNKVYVTAFVACFFSSIFIVLRCLVLNIQKTCNIPICNCEMKRWVSNNLTTLTSFISSSIETHVGVFCVLHSQHMFLPTQIGGWALPFLICSLRKIYASFSKL